MKNAKLAKAFNELSLLTGQKQFLTTIFDGPDGFYYDPVGDEIFEVTRVSTNSLGPVYRINFGDEVKIGNIRDHGFHLHLD